MRVLAAVAAAVALAVATASTSGRPLPRTPLGTGRHGAAAARAWVLQATRVDGVPSAVLHAAASVTVAVIDTGANFTAPDLVGRSSATWNTRTHSSDVRDVNGHGTFVASLAAAASGDARLLVIKSGSDGGSFTDADEAAGIRYAVDHGARIVNLSVGGPRTSQTEKQAVRYAVAHGVLLVTAVGNEGQSGNPVEYPAALVQPVRSDGIGGSGLAVTATTAAGRRAPFANRGSWVSLAAPGDHVYSASSGYGSGTSYAAPLVAGAAALVWAANPSLTAQQVAAILKETASGHGTWTADLGFGVIDVAAAVARAEAS